MFSFYQLDLANASAGGEIVAVTDEFFAECKNMIKPEPALFCPGRFTGMRYIIRFLILVLFTHSSMFIRPRCLDGRLGIQAS